MTPLIPLILGIAVLIVIMAVEPWIEKRRQRKEAIAGLKKKLENIFWYRDGDNIEARVDGGKPFIIDGLQEDHVYNCDIRVMTPRGYTPWMKLDDIDLSGGD